jgi:RNA polymerase sigma factor for flagellar operon FliA
MATSPGSSVPNDIFAGMMPPFIWAEDLQEEPLEESQPEPDRIAVAPVVSLPVDSGAAREQVLLAHMPLVQFVARKIHERLPQHVELEDLVSAGIVGLIDAFNKFDAGKNVQFKSYAQFRVRGAILDSLRTLDWGSREIRRKGRSIEEATQRLIQRLGRRPVGSEIAVELGMSLSAYQQLLGELKSLEVGSLHEAHSEDSAEEELAYLPTAPEDDPLYRCMKSEAAAQLIAAIAALPEREGRVLALYYVEEMTQKEIGMVLGLVESRVSQIRAAAVVSLRAQLAGKRMEAEIRPEAKLDSGSKRRQPMVPGIPIPAIPAAVIEKSAAVGHGERPRMVAR